MATPSTSFPRKLGRPVKRAAGRGGISTTPVHVRATGTPIAPELDEYARTKLARRLGKFAPAIERVSVRFTDVNGPRGGIDIVSRIKVVLRRLASVVVEERGGDAREAFDLASHVAERAVRRSLGRAGFTVGRRKARAPLRRVAAVPPNVPPPGGSLIGRRVGRSKKNLVRTQTWDPTVDTSLPGVSATDRKAGRGSTAARNVKLATTRATAALEDSATGRPSRKSTRKSANRAKSGSKQFRLAKARAVSPKARAARER